MSDISKILDTIKKPFRLEAKNNCQDRIVIGGLGSYVTNWVDKALNIAPDDQKELLSNLQNLFADYPDAQPDERKDKLREAIQVIKRLKGEQTSEPSNKIENKITDNSAEPKNNRTTENKKDLDLKVSLQVEVATDSDLMTALSTSVENIAGIGLKTAKLLGEEVGIHNLADLLEYYPRDYLDRSQFVPIYQVGRSGSGYETVQGIIVNQMEITPRRAKARKFMKTVIYDETGVACLVAFGKRVQYMKNALKNGMKLVVSGKFKRDYGEIQTTDYTYEVLSDEEAELIHTGRIVPVYPLTAKLNQRSLRRWIKSVVDNFCDYVPEILPADIRERQELIDRPKAVRSIHFPESKGYLSAARKRLAFDELFLLELGMGLKKSRWDKEEPGIAFQTKTKIIQDFVKSLPFELTNAQKRVFSEIKKDMEDSTPMNRLLQGDVGSGKTVVAAMALLMAIDNGYQGAIMAPTEILAEQHYNTLTNLLGSMGLQIVLLRGDMTKSLKDEALTMISTGEANIAVGTHALIQEGVEFANLGIEITDEQHRFGVMQRAALKNKGINPDALVMTATPIPRTLALTVYGDLNVSVIDELPPGRKKVETRWVAEGKRNRMYKFIEDEITKGRQAYIVYPLVEESEKLEDLKAATEMAQHFQEDVFPHLKIGLLHGRMKSEEKQEVMTRFKDCELNILVSTTVIEVGIDVPNATIMLIEHAERFGLAQLHQLRGRVGRSHHKSYCLLVANPKNEDAVRRMKAMTRTTDGFEIAEEDLAIRGPGEFFGTRQAGMPDLKVASLIRDAQLLEIAREEAFRIAQEDPALLNPEHQMLKKLLQEKWRENLEMISIG
ncbi:ATP-dependent DNA helicase RecG [Candidatus Poribacteria bacterium]|nr:ATP-dependent DNA helicase RecG [Candidatus Poribacteria bacterium]